MITSLMEIKATTTGPQAVSTNVAGRNKVWCSPTRSPGISLHHSEIPPEILQTLRAAEERGEVGGVHQQYVAGALASWWQPKEGVEFRVARLGERMRTTGVDELSSQHMH